MNNNNKYSLFTTIGMIVGIVIGSGIFFKSDNILIATNGSIILGVVIFIIAAISIVFGSLTLSELASRTDNPGGVIAYAEEFCNPTISCAFGWFYSFLYYPAIVAIIGWVSGIFICQLFDIESTLLTQCLLGLGAIILLFISNILSRKLGGYLQNAATIIKLFPLILIAIVGLILGDPKQIDISNISSMKSLGWASAITPIAFSFDGWIVATTISSEIKNAKRNLPLALIFSPIFILLIYIAYFVGISIFVGPENIMNLGDGHVAYAANNLIGGFGTKVLLIFINISVLGTLNGLILGIIRLPYSLGIRGMLPLSKQFAKLNDKLGISIPSAIGSFIISLIWLILHYLTQKYNLLPNSDVSEIPIVFGYILYIVLYVKVFSLGNSGVIKGIWKGRINPIMAILGSLTILLGSISNPMFITYTVICTIIVIASIIYWKRFGEQKI
jgi:APA family basic amino acid/polyamine antiporter